MRVVRATVEDAELCFRIARAGALAGFQHVFPSDLYEFPADAIRSDWISALTNPDGETYIAFDEDEAAGVISLSDGVLQTLYVMPECWGRGVGNTLHDFALDRLREANVQEARLWTLTENRRARAFYEKRGWILTGARASCRSRPIRLTSSMPARHFAASSRSGGIPEHWRSGSQGSAAHRRA